MKTCCLIQWTSVTGFAVENTFTIGLGLQFIILIFQSRLVGIVSIFLLSNDFAREPVVCPKATLDAQIFVPPLFFRRQIRAEAVLFPIPPGEIMMI